MVDKKLVNKLIDFFLENESPLAIGVKRNQMGSNYANPPMESLINCVSFIARNMPYIPENSQEELIFDKVSPYFIRTFDNF